MVTLDASPDTTPAATMLHLDALIVGGGFSGIAALHRFRKLGLKTKIFEAGSDLGGTWYWNRYPGARVDSEWPFYQLNIPEVYGTFNFRERFPDHRELRRYFAHVDSVIDVKRDTYFNARVVDCTWDDETARWTVRTEADQHVVVCKYLLLCTGLLVRGNLPEFPGLGSFAGAVHHSSAYPESLDARGKRVAVVGMGATAVQIIQELGKEADQLTVLMRRLSHCLPSGQQPIPEAESTRWQRFMGALLEQGRRDSPGGFPGPPKPDQMCTEETPEERERRFEEWWGQGGFSFAQSNYADMLVSPEANRGAYEFWARKTRARMTDPRKMDLLAPLPAERSPYHIFTKRTPLETDFYEVVDRPNVDLVDLNTDALDAFNETGARMKDGRQIDFDVLILATGFEAFSGAVTSMGLKNRSGVDLKDCWSESIQSYLGIMIHGFPNAFMLYSAQAPTAFSNGTTIIETQADFVSSLVTAIESSAGDEQQTRRIKSVDVTEAAQREWGDLIEAQCAPTLLPLTKSWWNGGNTPHRKLQMLTYALGIPAYEQDCLDRLKGWKGFDLAYWDDDAKPGEADGLRN